MAPMRGMYYFLGGYSMRKQLMAGFVCLSLIAFAIAIATFIQLSHIKSHSIRKSSLAQQVSSVSSAIAIDSLQCRRYEKDMFINMTDSDICMKYHDKWASAFNSLQNNIRLLDLIPVCRSNEDHHKIVLLLEQRSTRYKLAVNTVFARIKSGDIDNPRAANIAISPFKNDIRALIKLATQYGIDKQGDAQRSDEEMTQAITRSRVTIGILAIGALVVGGCLALILSGVLTRRARYLCNEVEQIASGRYDARIMLDGRDELAVLGSVIDKMAERIEERTAALEQDIVSRKAVEKDLQEAKQRFELAVRGSRDGIWDWNLLTNKVYYAPSWKSMLGLDEDEVGTSPEEWIGRIISDDLAKFQSMYAEIVKGTKDDFECELRMLHEGGNIRWMLCRGVAVRDEGGRAVRLAGSLADITEIKETQEALRQAAEHDRLTQLGNRKLFHDHLQRAIYRLDRDSTCKFAVLFFDFDRFKVVNDSLGHDAGDALLMSIADRFRDELRVVDTAARFGGDEFVVLLTDIKDIRQVEEVADRLLKVFEVPHIIDKHRITSTASIGLVTSDMGYDKPEDVIRDADAAMYQAKSAGRARVVRFDKTMYLKALDRLELEGDLRAAIEHEEFRLYYQPIVDLESGCLTGFEALIRWEHPQRGLVPPLAFITIAEDTGMIIEMGQWIIKEACYRLADWNRRLGSDGEIFLNINVSKRQLCHPNLPEVIHEAITTTGIKPEWLKIEITESTIVDNRIDMVPILKKIKSLGVQIAMDDFGTGQSSLSGLHRFPIDVLKIDQSFVQSMEESRELAAVVHSIITLAHHLNMKIVAEGVETAEQLAALQAQDCEFGQGYYFAKPMCKHDAEKYLLGAPRVKAA